jgi:hypothetical protein
LDQALDELTFLKHPKTVTSLEEFIRDAGSNPVAARKAVQVLTCIEDDEALYALARLFRTEALDSRIRKLVLTAICKNQSSVAVEVLQELARTRGPLSDEVRTELKSRQSV